MIVAVDGPAAAGKGTLSAALARTLGFARLDTGLLYRAVGLELLRRGEDPADPAAAARAARSLSPAALGDPALRGDEAAGAASIVAAIAEVRAALLALQRDFARNPPGGAAGAVLDGRDIGTQVCPDAPVKLFVTADIGTRVGRRVAELRGRGEDVYPVRVESRMRARDQRDSSRRDAPMKAADDACVIDSSDLTPEEVLTLALDYTKTRLRAG